MGRLIDADALKANINTAFWSEIEKIIDSAPTIEARPKEGKWVYQFRDSENEEYRCSVCGFPQEIKQNFCPNCGADMRGECSGTDKDKFEQ